MVILGGLGLTTIREYLPSFSSMFSKNSSLGIWDKCSKWMRKHGCLSGLHCCFQLGWCRACSWNIFLRRAVNTSVYSMGGEMMCPSTFCELMAKLTGMPIFPIHKPTSCSPGYIFLQSDEHLRDGRLSLHFCAALHTLHIIDWFQYLWTHSSKVPNIFINFDEYTVQKNRKKKICLAIKALS